MANKKQNALDQQVEVLETEIADLEKKIEDGKKARKDHLEKGYKEITEDSVMVVEHFKTANGTKFILDIYKSLDMNPSVNLNDALMIQRNAINWNLNNYIDELDKGRITTKEANDYFDPWIDPDFAGSNLGEDAASHSPYDLVKQLTLSRLASLLHEKWVPLIEYEAQTKAGLETMQEQLKEKQEELSNLKKESK